MSTGEQEHQARITEARHSYTGKGLTDSQFKESWALAGVIKTGIQATGSFNERLTDYSHAFARNQKFDAMKGEAIIRDIFKARYGQTMNQMRENLMQREDAVRDIAHDQALTHARGIENLISEGDTMPFYKAYDRQSAKLANDLGITQAGAKTMMKEAYRKAEDRELYDTGKALEDKYHKPKVEAERAAREQERSRSRQR